MKTILSGALASARDREGALMRPAKLVIAFAVSGVALALHSSSCIGQQITGVPGSPSATTTISGKELPPPDPKFGGVIKEKASESKAWWPPRVVPPKGAPNVLLIMTDDCGFGSPSTFGGVVPTPAMDRIAKGGLRYTNFHSTSLCSPSRAALITGRNHHVAGFGVVGEIATGFPGYDSIIRKENGTIGAILKENGYATSWFGKDHNTPFYQATSAGPFEQWPNGMGFEYFYGFVGGDTSQWQPNLFRNTTAIFPFQGNPGWNLTTAMADEAIQYMKELKEVAPDKPFLVYYVPGGTHSPHHPTPEWIKKISDMHLFDGGWNKIRETIFANQKRLGIMPANAQLTPWPKDLPEWDTLSIEQKTLFIKQADVFGAYLAYTDYEIGRVIQAVEDMGQLDNTLIIYIAGDNGASAEGMLNGTPNEFTTFNGVEVPVKDQFLWYPFWGSERTFPHFAAAWAWAMDTPFKWMKQVASHFGGTAQGVAMSWPGHINDAGGIRRQFHHLIDIAPTILEATGIPLPDTVDGIKQRPMDGVSMAYTWDKTSANAPDPAYDAVLRDARQPRHLPRRLARGDNPGDAAMGTQHQAGTRRDHGVPVGALQRHGGSHREQRPGCQDAGQAEADAGDLLRRGEEARRAAARQYDAHALERAEAEPHRGAKGLHVLGRAYQRSQQRRTEHPEQGIHDHRGGCHSRRRRRGHDRHRRRALRRLWPVSEQRRSRLRPGQGRVPLQPARPQAHDVGRARAGRRQTHDRLRLQVRGSRFGQGWDRRALGGRQGSGQEFHGALDPDHVPRRRNLRRRPGHPHAAGADRVSLRLPFKFTGKINRVTFNLGAEQYTEEDRKKLQEMAEAYARAKD